MRYPCARRSSVLPCVLLAAFASALICACRKDEQKPQFDCSDEAATALYERRIRPILNSDMPVTCNQCHLSGIDISIFVRATPCQTMACLQQRGLVDFVEPEQSKVLSWIDRAKPESELITTEVIAREHAAFLEWIRYSAACGEEVCPPFIADACGTNNVDAAVSCSVAAPIPDAAVDPNDCGELALEQAFSSSVYRWRERCYPCHFVGDKSVANTPQWVWDNAIAQQSAELACGAGSLETMRTVLQRGYVDLDAPARSLLLLKPLAVEGGGVPHGGDQKFAGIDDLMYKDVISWISRYAECAANDPSLPKPGTPPPSSDAGQTESPYSIYGYCNCMLLHCHDESHEKWGESDEQLLAGCRAEAITLPVKGEQVTSGKFLECRAGACVRAALDPRACQDAIGVLSCN